MEIRPVGATLIQAAVGHGQRTRSSRLRERALRNPTGDQHFEHIFEFITMTRPRQYQSTEENYKIFVKCAA